MIHSQNLPRAVYHSHSTGLDILSSLLRGVDILSLRYADPKALTVSEEVSTSLSGHSSLRIRQEVSLPVKKSFPPSGPSKETFREKVGLPLSSPSTLSE